jgi:hypothetical protein
MEENEFRDALRTVLTQSDEPPPMESATAVAAGRRATRRRTVLACTGAVAALAAVTIVPARYLSTGPGNAGDIQVAAPASTPSVLVRPPSKGVPEPSDTKPSWPAEASGDATADSGPRYQAGKGLLDSLLTVVPDGYATPTGSAPDGAEYQSHQAAIEDPEWSYLASVTITKAGGAGQLFVEVHEPDNKLPKEPCALAKAFWGIGGTCQVRQVGAAKVGVVEPTGPDKRLDTIAAYRYADGVVVFVAQSRGSIFERPALPAVPFTVEQLAALTQQKSFHVGK